MRLGKTQQEDRLRAPKYQAVGRALLETANALDVIGDAKYGNGLAIVAVHAAIAYTDALTVAYRELKSTDGEHIQAVNVLMHALGRRVDEAQTRRLKKILNAKTDASYSGSYYTLDDGREILEHAREYAAWAERMLADRPG